jgi:hypothetical protein
MLALAHYSLRLSSVFVSEQCFAFVTDNYFRVQKITKPLALKELYDKGMHLICLFRNEHIYKEDVKFENFVSRMGFLQDEGLLKIENETITLVESNKLQTPLQDLYVQMC